MRNRMLSSICTLAIGVVVLDASLARAQNASESPQAKLAASLEEIRLEVINTRDQLQASVDALNAFTKQKAGDLRPAYEKYVAEVKKTHEASQKTSARSRSMQEASKDYFGAWQTEVAGIANESLRSKAQRRLDDVRKSYDKVIASLRQATAAFKPFLSNLDDVQKALANDITAGGVSAIRGVVSDANDNEKKVLRHVNEGISQLVGMEKKLSPQKAI